MNKNVQPTPFCADLIEHGLQLSGNGDVDRAGDRRAEFAGKRLNIRSCLLIEPGDREVCARSVERLRTSVGYRVVVRHTNYKRFLSRKNGAESLVAH